MPATTTKTLDTSKLTPSFIEGFLDSSSKLIENLDKQKSLLHDLILAIYDEHVRSHKTEKEINCWIELRVALNTHSPNSHRLIRQAIRKARKDGDSHVKARTNSKVYPFSTIPLKVAESLVFRYGYYE